MALDKKILREAMAHHQAWNEEKLLSQDLQHRRQSPQRKWQAYQDFCFYNAD
jgi:hypothetical protein